MKPIIEVNNLSKRYSIGRRESYGSLREEIADAFLRPFRRIFSNAGDSASDENTVWALRDVSFNVMEGEIVGIIGKNGAGKSTLLKILSRITEPTKGSVVMRGRVASLLEVGTGFHPELTGRENIFLNGALLGMTSAEIKARFDDIVEFSEIERFLDTPVKRYSSGMYVRLAFAVAAHLEPEILVVDEVLAVGDSAFQRKCLGKMGDVARGGRTVFFVSHNMPAVQMLCTSAILLAGGHLSAAGETDAIVNRYLADGKEIRGKDLFNIQRHGEFGKFVKIARCRILDSNEFETDTLKFGEPFSVELECIGIEPTSDLQFAIGISSALDERLTTIVSNEPFSVSRGETVKGVLKVRGLVLTPGNYMLTLGVRNSSTGHDQLVNVACFEISCVRAENFLGVEVLKGFLHVTNPEWHISK